MPGQRRGGVFPLRIPFVFDLTYLVGLDGHLTMTPFWAPSSVGHGEN